MMENKKINFCIGIFDELSEKGLEKIKNEIANSEIYGIGVYTEKIVKEKFFTCPKNDLEKRMEFARNIEGVKFVFSIDTINPEELKKIVKNELMRFIETKNIL